MSTSGVLGNDRSLADDYEMDRRVLRWAGVLMVGGASAGLAAYVDHVGLDDADKSASVFGAFVGLIGTFALFWDRVLARRATSTVGRLEDSADALAQAVRTQWEEEYKLRRLNDPYPLPVSWRAADFDLMEEWSLLEATAADWPNGSRRDTQGWATSAPEISGAGGEILSILNKVPTKRLVVLGEPGSGKTMLLVRMLLDSFERRHAGEPVPVLFSLASWNPLKQSLSEWLVDRLTQDYAALRNPAPGVVADTSCAQALLDHRMIFPILDGFDEIPERVRPVALGSINAALSLGQGAVLSSRIEEYRTATQGSASAVPVKLASAAAIELNSLDTEECINYLLRDAGGSGTTAASRWSPVFHIMRGCPDAPVKQALRTPLMLFLVRTIYNPRPGESTGSLPGPSELCNPSQFPDAAAIERHLFDAYIPAAYRHNPESRARPEWSAADAERWFKFLAEHLEERLNGTTDIAWWKLLESAPKILPNLVTALIGGLACGLGAGFGSGVGIGFGLGVGAGIICGFTAGLPLRSIGNVRTSLSGFMAGLVGGLLGGLVAGLVGMVGLGYAVGPAGGIAAGLGVGVAVGPASGLAGGFAGGLVGGAIAGMLSGIGIGLPSGLMNGLGVGLAAAVTVHFVGRKEPAQRLDWKPIGVVGGVTVGMAVGIASALVAGIGIGSLVGIIVGIASALVAGLAGASADPTAYKDPQESLAGDSRTFFIYMTATLAAVWAISTLITGIAVTTENQLSVDLGRMLIAGAMPGLSIAIAVSVVQAFTKAVWGAHTIARIWLSVRRCLPWRLMEFLADAHKKGVLRQAGASYQFRHAELQRRLASRDA